MKKTTASYIECIIPTLDQKDANALAQSYLEKDYLLDTLLPFLPFFDSSISNQIFAKAIKQNCNIELLLTAMNPYTSKELNDRVTLLAIEHGVNAETIVDKAFPFVGLSTANRIVDYAISSNCAPENILNAAPPFVSPSCIEKLICYSLEKKVAPTTLAKLSPFFTSKNSIKMIQKYLTEEIQENNHGVLTNNQKEQLIQIFNDSGIDFDITNLNTPLELDSLHYISIICEIETAFDVEIPNEVLTDNKLSTFNDFLRLINDVKGD